MNSFELDARLAADTELVAHWPLCEVLLMKDSQYPWLILVPRREGVTELYQLSREDRLQWLEESTRLGRWLMEEFAGDKLNLAALGNQVPQLHFHHIIRYRTDPAWPGPVWGKRPVESYGATELVKQKERLKPLKNIFQ